MARPDPTPLIDKKSGGKKTTPRLTSRQVAGIVANPATTEKQFEALRLRMIAKGWRESTIGVVMDVYRAVQARKREAEAAA